VLALRLAGFQVVPSAQEGKRGVEWALQLLSTLWHGGCLEVGLDFVSTDFQALARHFGRLEQMA